MLPRKQKDLAAKLRRARWLPLEFVAEFEARFVRARDSEPISFRRRKARAQNIWRAAQRAISAVAAEPGEWFYHTYEIYDYFFRTNLSVKYVNIIIKIMNLWGFFISRKLAQPFLPLPQPRGYERARLIENYYHKKGRFRGASLPIKPEMLRKLKRHLLLENYNWIFLSVWFGLRPQEIDNLHDKNMWYIENPDCGKLVLWVY